MALSLPPLPEHLQNGPEEIGLAAGIDKCKDPKFALCLNGAVLNVHVVVAHIQLQLDALLKTEDLKKFQPLVRQVYRGAVVLQLCTTYDNENTTALHSTLTQEGINAAAESCKADNDEVPLSYACLMLISTKVNWWQTNHHTGQEGIQGYPLKVLLMILRKPRDWTPPPELREFVWAAGHTISTVATLMKLGAKGVTHKGVQDPVKFLEAYQLITGFPKATDDIVKRLNGGVAGVMKTLDTIAALEGVASTPYAYVIMNAPDPKLLYSVSLRIKENPASFHKGAWYLTGQAPAEYNDPPDSTLELGSAIIHSAFAGTTLSKNKTLPPKAQIQSHYVFLGMCALKKEMVKTGRAKFIMEKSTAGQGLNYAMIGFGQKPPTVLPGITQLPNAGTAVVPVAGAAPVASAGPPVAKIEEIDPEEFEVPKDLSDDEEKEGDESEGEEKYESGEGEEGMYYI